MKKEDLKKLKEQKKELEEEIRKCREFINSKPEGPEREMSEIYLEEVLLDKLEIIEVILEIERDCLLSENFGEV